MRRLWGLIARNCPSLPPFLPLLRVFPCRAGHGKHLRALQVQGGAPALTDPLHVTWTQGLVHLGVLQGHNSPKRDLYCYLLLPPKSHESSLRGLERSGELDSWVVFKSVCFWGFYLVWEARRERGGEQRLGAEMSDSAEREVRRREGG